MRDEPISDDDPPRPLLQIGEVAARVDLSIRSIRHWEEMGLVKPSSRSPGGFRLYSEEDVARIKLLRYMKPLNFTLDQMRHLLEIRELLSAEAETGDRESALVWPRTGQASDEDSGARLRQDLEHYLDRAEERLEKLRDQVAEVEDFVSRLRDEARHASGAGPRPR
jgi:DNA-binding transcriptional MerR regulator